MICVMFEVITYSFFSSDNIYFHFCLDYAYKRNNLYYNKYGVPTSLGKRAVVLKTTQTWPGGVIPYDMSSMTRKFNI